ncbi:hypothetical protein C8J57DRAFT_1230253 [Mycena rebaudengoi]|nr:hypothetical protein C8J57DRAFT_1230253 [Mycena rebaudengoi]
MHLNSNLVASDVLLRAKMLSYQLKNQIAHKQPNGGSLLEDLNTHGGQMKGAVEFSCFVAGCKYMSHKPLCISFIIKWLLMMLGGNPAIYMDFCPEFTGLHRIFVGIQQM